MKKVGGEKEKKEMKRNEPPKKKKEKERDTKDRLLMRFSVGSGVEATLFVNVLRLSLKFDCFCLPNNI